MALTKDKFYESLLIQPTERQSVVFFFTVFFLIGCGLSLGRGTADALFFKRYGIEYLPLMFSLAGILLGLVFTLYAAFVDQISSNRLLARIFNVSAFLIFGIWLIIRISGNEHVYPVYFLVYEVVSEVLILHLSLYVSQNFTTQQAKRLVPLIFAGTQSGYILGGALLAGATHFLNVADILLLWFSLLIIASRLIVSYHDENGASPYYRPGRKAKNQIQQAVNQLQQGLAFAKSSSMLKSMSWGFFFMVIAFYTLCYSTNRLYNQTFTSESELAAFFGIMGSINASIALLLQLFVTSRVIKYFGVQKINLVFPVMISISFMSLLGAYILPLAILATFTKDAIMPAFRNPVRNIFFNALPLQFQGRARAITIGLILPLALCTTGLILWLVQRTELPYLYLMSGLLMSLSYLFFNFRMNKSYVPTIVSSLRQKVYVPEKGLFNSSSDSDEEMEKMLHRGIDHDDAEISFAAAKTLLQVNGSRSINEVLPTLKNYNHSYQDKLVRIMFPYLDREHIETLWTIAHEGDAHLQSTVKLEFYRHYGSDFISDIVESLSSDNPRIVATGIYGVYINNISELTHQADDLWHSLLYSSEPGKILSAIELITKFAHKEFSPRLVELTYHPHQRVRHRAAFALSNMGNLHIPGIVNVIDSFKDNTEHRLRVAACKIAENLPISDKERMIKELLNDPHPEVRVAAAQSLFHKGVSVASQLKWIFENAPPPRALKAIIGTLMQKEPNAKQVLTLCQWLANRSLDYVSTAKAAAKLLNTKNDGMLLAILLKERGGECLKLTLETIENIEDYDIVTTAKAAINSNDNSLIDNAIEAMLGLSNKQLAKTIIDTLSIIRSRENTKNHTEISLEDIISISHNKLDPWLTLCIDRFKSRLANSKEPTYA